jgi:hypothetical protein
MHQLNKEFNGQLDLAIHCLKEITIENLCCSVIKPIDMDRMDYLKTR